MIDLPIGVLLDERRGLVWLERHLPAEGSKCPRCGGTERRLCRAQGQVPAYRCRACDGSDTRRTDTVFATTRPPPATRVLRRRGVATGEPTARLARELGVSRQQRQTLRQRLQAHLNATAPTGVMTGTAGEADALYQTAGETQHAFRGGHTHDLHQSGATDEAMVHAQRITSHVIQRLCVGAWSPHTSYT